MFTGIISTIGDITYAHQSGGDLRIRIACQWDDLAIGESVAVSGACLTVVEKSNSWFEVDVSAETVARTAPNQWQHGTKLNLERALQLSERLSGHFVTGHVDGLALLRSVTPSGGSHVLSLEAPQGLAAYITAKGSVTLDGVSLTVNEVEGNNFQVNIIPHSWQHTTLGMRRAGDWLNLEIDLIARYVKRLMPTA